MIKAISVILAAVFLLLPAALQAGPRYLNQVKDYSCKYCHSSVESISANNMEMPPAERYKLNAIGLAIFNDAAAYKLLKERGGRHEPTEYKK